jgi:hypothetical protein
MTSITADSLEDVCRSMIQERRKTKHVENFSNGIICRVGGSKVHCDAKYKEIKKLTVQYSWMCRRVPCRSLQTFQRNLMTHIYGVEEQGVIQLAACLPGNIRSSDASVTFYKTILSHITERHYRMFITLSLYLGGSGSESIQRIVYPEWGFFCDFHQSLEVNPGIVS